MKNFQNFSYLNLSECYINETTIRFISNNKLALDSDLSINFNNKKFTHLNSIEFYHLNGIDLGATVFKIPDMLYPFVIIKFSNLIFYNKKRIITEKDCNSEEIFNSFDSLFTHLPGILQFYDCIYTQKICSFVFKNSIIYTLMFNYFTSSLLKTNYLQFSSNIVSNTSITTIVETVEFFDFFLIDLNSILLNKQVFTFLKKNFTIW